MPACCGRLRAAAYAVSFIGHPLRARTFSRDSAGGMFRHHISCWDAGGRAGASDPEADAIGGYPIQRYGFHGLSCESIVHQLGRDLPGRLIIAHLGNGASVTAVRDGGSIDTSMGLTPSGGVIMGTRSGDLDPGVLIYLMREKKFNASMLEALVGHRCGLAGISGVGSDMRRLREAASSNADAGSP